MRNRFLIFFIFLFSYCISQESPLYYHYVLNDFYLNPAIVGAEMKATVRLSDMHSHLFQSNMPNYQVISLTDRLGSSGLGWSIYSDRAPGHNAKGFQFSYAYHYSLEKNKKIKNPIYLSIGISALANIFINENSVSRDNNSISNENTISDMLPNLNMGVYLYNNHYYTGLSFARPFKYQYDGLDNIEGENRNATHIYALAGYKWFQKPKNYIIEPSILFIYKEGMNVALDGTIQAHIQKKYMVSLTHRMIEREGMINKFICPGGLVRINSYELGYSTDIPYGNRDTYTFFQQRIMIGYIVSDRKGNSRRSCPAYW